MSQAPKNGCIAPETIVELLREVDKPARYVGGELNSVVKEHSVRCRVALAFPDVYEVAESHIGLKILYDAVNRHAHLAAERVYALWPDLEKLARSREVPLWSLETYRPLHAFDVVGFTLQYELTYPTVLGMLEHGGIAVRSEDRTQHDPFVIAGGAGAVAPEPMADFVDAFFIGDGEEGLLDIMEAVARGREEGHDRDAILNALAAIDGVYVPSHYRFEFDGVRVTEITALPGTPKHAMRGRDGRPRITRRALANLDAAVFPTATILPNLKPVHQRAAVEIQRGCSQSCRFCQAGMTNRPTRQRSPDRVRELFEGAIAQTGCEEVGFLSLSAGDYAPIGEVLEDFFARHRGDRIGVSLPSMRTSTLSPELAEQVASVKKSGFTLAPEAGSERLRRVINKTTTEQDLIDAVRASVGAGWRHLKLYFMIGLPTETDDDIDAIAQLAQRAREAGRAIRSDLDVTVSLSTFVPKPHTPFQWESQIEIEEIEKKQGRIADQLRPRGIGFKYHAPALTFFEGVLARGDRRIGKVIEAAARAGCRLDAWTEHCDVATWKRLLGEVLPPMGIEATDYLAARDASDWLPWGHIDVGILKKFLVHDRKRAMRGQTVGDCAFSGRCYACGGCDIADPYRSRGEPVSLQPVTYSAGALSKLEVPGADGRRANDAVGRRMLRFRYGKRERALFVSHLGLKDQILRAVRLSGLPVRYTEGYSPRPRVAFSPACPTGIQSEAEFFDAECHSFVGSVPVDWLPKVARFLPRGLELLEVAEVPVGGPSLQAALASTDFEVAPPVSYTTEQVGAAIDEFNAAQTRWVSVLRKGKTRLLDARAQVTNARLQSGKMGMTIRFAAGVSLKPIEAVATIFGTEAAAKARIRKIDCVLLERVREDASVAVAGVGVDPQAILNLGHLGDAAPKGKPKPLKRRRKKFKRKR